MGGTLQLHRAERADRLVDALAGVLADPPDDPFVCEVVGVHARGIERWLQQELSLRLGTTQGGTDGVAANIDFPFPASLVTRALAAVSGIDPDDDPWPPARQVWPLLELLDEVADEPWLAPLRWHVAGDDDDAVRRGRRFPAARHIADLFDRYGVHRPEMVRAWAEGHDVDGAGHSLADDADAWQPELWRRLRARLGVPSPAERLVEATARLGDPAVAVPDLPERLSLFGLTALPTSYVSVLTALAQRHEVHLFLLHPSARLWEAVAAHVRALGGPPRRREADPTKAEAENPLLSSWGRDAREMQLVLSAAGAPGGEHLPVATPATSLLGHIQADVWANRPVVAPAADEDDRPELAPGDCSLQIHACHGRMRQVEVMRDAVLHLLDEIDGLEPRDILIMCPDIETFAPLISAVFGAEAVADDGTIDRGGMPDMRVKLADRAIRQTNPLLRVVSELLALADGRLTASEVLALAGREPVRRRFGFDDDAMEQIEHWIAEAGIRWGLDADHREAFGLSAVAENTWRSGLDRVLLGVTMPDEDDRLVGDCVPLDDVPEQAMSTAGGLAELVDRLDRILTGFRGVHTITQWRTAILEAADLLTATGERDRWRVVQLERLLDDVVGEARGRTPSAAGTNPGAAGTNPGAAGINPGAAGIDAAAATEASDVPLSLPEVRSLLEDRLKGRPTRASHRTGDLTVCTLVPMRSVPHRVIGLLGMDDGTFPRRTAGDGDDLIDRDPHVGDRDARTEDRQLLLDALLAAADALVVTYTGRDERTNDHKPPAVPVGELLDVVDRTVRLSSGEPARTRVVVEHPLQPFDRRNFERDRLAGRERWSYDRTALHGATAMVTDRVDPQFLHPILDEVRENVIALQDLIAFVEHPVKAFLRRRLDIHVSDDAQEVSDSLPVELSPLEDYAVGSRLLDARLAGVDANAWTAAERRRGTLPPGKLADGVLDDVTAAVDAIVTTARSLVDLDGARDSIDVDVDIGGARRVVGAVPRVAGDIIPTVQYSRVRPRQRLAAWVRLLAATAMQPDRPFRGLIVGRCSDSQKAKRTPVTTAAYRALGAAPGERQANAAELLRHLVAIYDEGLREPLPLYCSTSAAWAAATVEGEDGEGAARGAWTTTWSYPKEDKDPSHVLVLGGIVTFDEIHTDRFCDLALRLWEPLLGHETLENC